MCIKPEINASLYLSDLNEDLIMLSNCCTGRV